jgi:RHS repeat-associated protein
VHTDQLNTPRKVTSNASTPVLRWKWDPTPFGEGTPSEPAGAFKYNLRFPGQYFDSETNLNYNYFRDYDPAIGRYVESDPIGLIGGLNTYRYVGASPLRRTDKSGLVQYDPPEQSDTEGFPICNGRGGIEIQFPPLDEKKKKCIYDCLRKHEISHIIDLRKLSPTICKGYKRGWIPYFDTKDEAIASERSAYDSEIRCLIAKLEGMSACDECKPVVEKRLNDAREDRKAL